MKVRHKFKEKRRLSDKFNDAALCVLCGAYRENGTVYRRKEYIDYEGFKHSVWVITDPNFCD